LAIESLGFGKTNYRRIAQSQMKLNLPKLWTIVFTGLLYFNITAQAAPPSAPAHLRSAWLDGSTAVLTWEDSPEAVTYKVYRFDHSASQWVMIASEVLVPTFWEVAPHQPTLQYAVTATNPEGESTASTVAVNIGAADDYLRTYSTVAGSLLNIDFGAHTNPFFSRKTGPAAIGKEASDIWNLYSRDDANGNWLDNNQLANLQWSDGAASSIHLAVNNAAGAWYSDHTDSMFQSYLYPANRTGNISAVLQNLPAGTYDVYVYAHGQIPSENGVIELSTESENYATKVHSSAPGWNTPAWTEGNHYVLFREVTIGNGESLRFFSRPGESGLAVINGMQLLKKLPLNSTDITIHWQPQDQFAPIGRPAELTVAATSFTPITYQWFFNGDPLPGQTGAALRIENVQVTHTGSYHVRLDNGVSTIESEAARLDPFTLVEHPLLNIDFGAHQNPVFRLKSGPASVGWNDADRWNLYSRDDGHGGWLSQNQI
jgi:hypothetical protein